MKNRSLIVDVVSRWVAPLIFVFGLYVIMYGHLSPGGGFPGGVVLSSAFILVLLARGRDDALRCLPFALAKKLDAAGALLFLLLAWAGLALSGVFFVNVLQRIRPGRPMHLWSGGFIVPANAAIGLKVAASLFLVMFALSCFRTPRGREDERVED